MACNLFIALIHDPKFVNLEFILSTHHPKLVMLMHNSKVHSEQEEMKNIHKDIVRDGSTFFHRKFTRSNVTIGACNR